VLDELNVKKLEFADKEAELDKPDYVAVSEGDYGVAIPTRISEELRMEGMAREIVRRIQTMRRSAGFDIADRIVTYYQGGGDVGKVMEDFADYIKQETLSLELIEGVPAEDAFADTFKLGGYEISLGVKRERPG